MKGVKIRFEKKGFNFGLILILIILTQSIVPIAVARNALLDEDISVKNPIYITTKYHSMNTKGDFVILSDEQDSSEVWDVSNPKKPSYVSKINSGFVRIINDNLYISDIGTVARYDLTNSVNFSDSTGFSTPYQFNEDIHVDDDYIYFLNLQSIDYVPENAYMLSIFDLNNWTTDFITGHFNSTLIGQFNSTSSYYGRSALGRIGLGYQKLHVENDVAYVFLNKEDPTDSSSIEIIDLSNKANPLLRSEINLPSAAHKIIIKNDIAFIPTAADSIRIYNISDLDSPTSTSSSAFGDDIYDIIIQDNIAYCVDSNTLRILDITDLGNIDTLGSYTLKNQGFTYFNRLSVQGGNIYIISSSQYSDRYFFTFDCSDITKPTKLYPKGIKLDSQTEMILILIGMIGGPILGVILVIVGIVLLVSKLKQRKLRNIQDEQEN